jgi:hypothetical protein
MSKAGAMRILTVAPNVRQLNHRLEVLVAIDRKRQRELAFREFLPTQEPHAKFST